MLATVRAGGEAAAVERHDSRHHARDPGRRGLRSGHPRGGGLEGDPRLSLRAPQPQGGRRSGKRKPKKLNKIKKTKKRKKKRNERAEKKLNRKNRKIQ